MAERWYPGWGLAVLRMVLGIVFLVHGWDKLFIGSGAVGIADLPMVPRTAAAVALQWGIAILEFLGGLLLLVGWLTRWVAGALFLEVLIALFVLRAEWGFFVFRTYGEWGYEYHLVLLGALGCLILAGGGKLAMDDWLLRWTTARQG